MNMNYFKPNKIQLIKNEPMMERPSSEDFLSQSIVQIVKNPGNSSVFVKNQNNNSIPNIQTGMLYSFNPSAFETFRKRQTQQATAPQGFQHENRAPRVNVNFSNPNNNYQQNFIRHPPGPHTSSNISNFQSVYPNRQIIQQQQRQPSHIMGTSNNRSHSVNIIRPHSSIVSIPLNTANHNQLNRPPFQRVVVSQPFTPLLQTTKESPLKRIRQNSQKKLWTFESIEKNNRNNPGQQVKLNLFTVNNSNNNRERDQNETSFEVVQSPVKNISSISIERSEYVPMPESNNKVEKRDFIEPIVNQPSPNPKSPQKRLQTSPVNNNTSMIFSIQQQPQSAARNLKSNNSLQLLTSNKQQLSPKSSPKLDNRAYFQQQQRQSMATMIQKLYSKESRLSSVEEEMGKQSKFSGGVVEKGQGMKQGQEQRQQYQSIELKEKPVVISSFVEERMQGQEEQQQEQRIAALQQKHLQQQSQLLQRITLLQAAILQKQQENTTLKSKLQNLQLSKTLQSQFQKLQMTSKLSEVEIKKLRNEIMMFKIKQRLYKNKEKQMAETINELKEELKVTKASGVINNNSSLVYAKSKVYQD